VQRQFESPDYRRLYVESHLPLFSGHFRIKKAQLERGCFRPEIVSRPKRSRFDLRRTKPSSIS
jgi:hypothetical protein